MIPSEQPSTVIPKLDTFSPETGFNGYNNKVRLSPSQYCRTVETNSFRRLFGVCLDQEGYGLRTWSISCLSVSVFFVLMTFIVYSVVPKLKNLQGSIFRCTLASYICCMIIYILTLMTDERANTTGFQPFVVYYGIPYFGFAWILWLNVMSFDVWKTFRNLRPRREVNNLDVRKCQRKKFICYSCYAWIGPVVLTFSLTSVFFFVVADEQKLKSMAYPWHYLPLVPIVGIAICNTCLFISTALKIRQHKQETAHIIDGSNKHRQRQEEWFNLYLKLFIIMEGPLIFWGVGIYLENLIFWWIVYLLEALQGTFIFLIFVWKHDVRKLVRKRFQEMLCTLRAFCRCGSIPATVGDENLSTELSATTGVDL